MSYKWGGTLLTSKMPLVGYVSIVGSIAGGSQLARSFASQSMGDTLAELHAAMLLEGTKKHTKQELQVALDTIGASLSFSATANRLQFVARVHTDYLDALFALIAECLTVSTFEEKEFVTLCGRTESDLALESQDTRAQAAIHLSRTLYSPGHPLRSDSTDEARQAIQTLTRDTLVQYHTHAISRESLIVSVVGDVQMVPISTIIEKHCSKLASTAIKPAIYEKAVDHHKEYIQTPIMDKSSVDYMLGITTGITSDHADYPALVLGLQILGNRSGFTGRLMKEIREKQGLTYGIYAYPSGFSIADGYITIWATFAPQLLEKGRAAIHSQIKKIRTRGIDSEEFKKHRAMFVAQSIVACVDSMSLARTAHEIVVQGKPIAYLDQFPQRILKLTKREVEAALKKYLLLDAATESVCGSFSL
ncbi:MAG: peptidase domain protein [Candidatus Kaiserbacteria bacterium]|nr:peptidase domain protein [Candidatus Kaiserbacteria bacterium]